MSLNRHQRNKPTKRIRCRFNYYIMVTKQVNKIPVCVLRIIPDSPDMCYSDKDWLFNNIRPRHLISNLLPLRSKRDIHHIDVCDELQLLLRKQNQFGNVLCIRNLICVLWNNNHKRAYFF